ncbi:MAG: hypothetical protein K5898_08295 [Ruminococcus sp.]|uniref:hypothetical protein n=1 Tax=Ruminococcus sp. TaxID=41978 RepID=UPI0025EDD583|nr:hypothetical protein [Ruminococcus sp.]MCR4795148.1 hypothetical protein [Ruminococcus sp.]
MKRFFAGIIALFTIGVAVTGCADKKSDNGAAAVEAEEKETVLTSEEIAEYIEKGAEINGFEKVEDAADHFIKAVKERDTSQLEDVFYIRDEVEYLMPIDQGIFGLIYKQAVALMAEPDYEVDHAKEIRSYNDEEMQQADDIANMYYVYASIEKAVTGGRELTDEERTAASKKIYAFDFDFNGIERPVKVTEGKFYEVGLKKGDDLITMLFSMYNVNGEKWLIQSVECNRKLHNDE